MANLSVTNLFLCSLATLLIVTPLTVIAFEDDFEGEDVTEDVTEPWDAFTDDEIITNGPTTTLAATTSKTGTEPGIMTTQSPTETPSESEPLSTGAIVGIALGSVAFVALIGGAIFFIIYDINRRKSSSVGPGGGDGGKTILVNEVADLGENGIEMKSDILKKELESV